MQSRTTQLAFTLWLVSTQAMLAQPAQDYTSKQVHDLIRHAETASDYQNLATYFRYRELVFRAKAQRSMDDYARCARNVTMSPKFQTRPDLDREAYEYYSFKATQSAKAAQRYEQILTARGIKPENTVGLTVPVGSLPQASKDVPSKTKNSLVSNPH